MTPGGEVTWEESHLYEMWDWNVGNKVQVVGIKDSSSFEGECCCNNTANVGSVRHNWNCTAGNLNNSMSIGDVTIPKQFDHTGIWKLNGTLATNDVAEATMYLKCKGLICLDKLGMATRNSSPSQGSLLLLNICYGLG
ncbi:unnamed protein product [Camellia sinensis]